MKNGPLFLVGLFAALAVSWGAMVLGSHAQFGALAPYYDDGENQSFPSRAPGMAVRGQLVYADLGCAACHTQQVRQPDFGSDQERGWGDRQSVARDYIYQARPQIGASRFGPDLANLAGRKPSAPDEEDLLKFLYSGSPTHPRYRFLFDDRPQVGERSHWSLKLSGKLAPAGGYEVVPTPRAQALVTYLLSLNSAYAYPEARPAVKAASGNEKKAKAPPPIKKAGADAGQKADAGPEKKAGAVQEKKADAAPDKKGETAPGKRDERPVPAPGSDEKKKMEGKK